MKYFKPKLWEKLNSEIEQERETAESEWERNDKKYWKSFQQTKQHLPEEFISVYQNNHFFHDYLISGIEIIKKPDDLGGSVSIEINISKGSQNWVIRYGNVTKFRYDFVAEKELSFYGGLNSRAWDEWGYDEFSGTDVLSHEILFSSGRTIHISFKKISIQNPML